MLLETHHRDVLSTEEGVETTKMGISKDVTAHILKVLTEYSYKSPKESAIREAVSNSIDSHTEAGVTDPVIVRLFKNDNHQWEFQAIDKGLGLDDVGFKKYIMGMGESSKRDNPNIIGGYGCGSKAWLAYTDSFNYTCIKDGIERKYLIFKGEEFPESMLIYEKETTERNGVTVSVIITSDWNEKSYFINAIKEQLSYFENIYFDIEGIDNSYSIFRSNDFQWNNLHTLNEMHITLKNVYYPINWDKLGIPKIYIPVALRFDDYSSIRPIFNREELVWDQVAKDAILDKIKKVSEWFITKYNSERSDIPLGDLVKRWWELNPKNEKFVKLEGRQFNIKELEQYSSIPVIRNKIENIDSTHEIYKLSSELLDNYTVVGKIDGCRYKSKFIGQDLSIVYRVTHGTRVMLVWGDLRKVQLDYLKDNFTELIIVRKNNNIPRKLKQLKEDKNIDFRSYQSLLALNRKPKESWRKLIEEFNTVEKQLEDNILKISDYQPTDVWLASRKANRKVGVRKTNKVQLDEINPRQVVEARRVRYKLDSSTKFLVKDLNKGKRLVIYDTIEEIDSLYNLGKLFSVPTYVLVDRDIERVKSVNPQNWFTVDEFMEGNNKFFKKLCINYQIYNLTLTLENRTNIDFIKRVNKDLYNKLKSLDKIKNPVPTYFYSSKYTMSEYLFIAAQNNYWNHPLFSTFEDVKKYEGKFDFLEYIKTHNEVGMKIAISHYINLKKKNKI